MKFAKWVFGIAGIYGLIAMLPLYFMETKFGIDHPPAITHPEFFYGFLGVGIAWQVAFFIIASDPFRYRLLMLPAALEKVLFFDAVIILIILRRIDTSLLGAAFIDLFFAVLFLIAFRRCKITADHP